MSRPIEPARKKRLEESFIKHAALARFHLWCELEAHAVRSSTVEILPSGRIALTAELDRQHDDGPSAGKNPVRCRVEMTALDGTLPHLVDVDIASAGVNKAAAPIALDARNRLLSLIHYFTSLVENPARDPGPFRELLADNFALHYVDPPISNFAMLDDWVTGRLASVVASNHRIHDVSFEATGDKAFLVTVAMESEALFPDGSGVISNNRQSWRVIDDPSERFARIGEIRIERDDVHRFDLPEAG